MATNTYFQSSSSDSDELLLSNDWKILKSKDFPKVYLKEFSHMSDFIFTEKW